jgi:hypothetical protein
MKPAIVSAMTAPCVSSAKCPLSTNFTSASGTVEAPAIQEPMMAKPKSDQWTTPYHPPDLPLCILVDCGRLRDVAIPLLVLVMT